MARFSRIDVALAMKETGIIPVFYHENAEVCIEVMMACYRGGARVFEFTNRGDNADKIFERLYHHAKLHAPQMMLGVGSIVDPFTAGLYIQRGADLIVSPILNAEVGKICNRRKVAWSPGCGSLSEISEAEELGAEVVKIFPGAQVGGPSFVKAAKGPMPWSSIMPTGGVNPTKESIDEWFGAGVHCVGMGSKLITKDIIENKNYDLLENSVKTLVGLVQGLDR